MSAVLRDCGDIHRLSALLHWHTGLELVRPHGMDASVFSVTLRQAEESRRRRRELVALLAEN